MVTIIAIDKDGNTVGRPRKVSDNFWNELQKFGKKLRWKEITKKEENGKKRSGIGNAVKKANGRSK